MERPILKDSTPIAQLHRTLATVRDSPDTEEHDDDYFVLLPKWDAREYRERVEKSGWVEAWPAARRARLWKSLDRYFGGDPDINRFDVFRKLATVELYYDSDSIVDVGDENASYTSVLRALAKGSFGAFEPTDIVDAFTSREKISEGVFVSPVAEVARNNLVVVSFRLRQFVYGGVFESGWLDNAFVGFVNRAIEHSGGSHFFAGFPSGLQPPWGVNARASEEAATLHFAWVTQQAFDRANSTFVLPWEDSESIFTNCPRMPAGSIANAEASTD